MVLKLPSRVVRLLNNDYRRSEGIVLAQSWIDLQSGKIDLRNIALNRNNEELHDIKNYVGIFME